MVTKVSSKGQVLLPAAVRHQLSLSAGDTLDIEVKRGKIILTPRGKRHKSQEKARIITDPVTGMPALSAGPNAPVLTSEQVAELLKDFP